jgi:hypothetical protein
MGRKCICAICKKQGTTDVFFKVVNEKGINKYYCSENEYNQSVENKLKRKELLTFVAEDVLNYEDGQIVPPVMVKKISELNKFYDYEVIRECFNVCKQDIQYWMTAKSFDNEFGMASYIMKIIESNINDIYKRVKFQQEQQKKQINSDVDLLINDIDSNKVKINTGNSILDFLDEEDI